MAGPARSLTHPADVLRKALIVASLIGGMLLLHQFAVPGNEFDPRGLLSLGFVVLAAYTVGELAGIVRIPHITGYVLAGILFGPSVAHLLATVIPAVSDLPPLDDGIVSRKVLAQLAPIDALALAMIALSAGGELKLDELRSSIRHVLATTLGMVGAVVVLVTGYVLLVTAIAPSALPGFIGLDAPTTLALALVVAVLAAATSPAVSIAVIASTGAKGPVTTTVLTGVVVGEITVVLLFSATSSAALNLLGGTGDVSVLDALASVGLSVVIGSLVGASIALYLRYVAAEILLFLVSVIFATTFVVQEVHGEAAVAFIAAGLVVGNFSDRGETLIREVERLSRPVYVVFFALAGAKLDIVSLWSLLLPALGLLVVRGAGVYFGSRGGARLAGAPPTVEKYAWMGFVSQAGLAIALAGQARAVLPTETGVALYSIALSVIALNEMIGPLVLQTGLGLAGEIGGGTSLADPVTPVGDDPDEVAAWPPPVDAADAWDSPRSGGAGSEALDAATGALELDLRTLVHEHVDVPIDDRRVHTEQWLRVLRREWLRVVRRAQGRVGPAEDLAEQLRSDVAELAGRWRALVADRSAQPTWIESAGLQPLADAVDRHAQALPVAVRAGVVDQLLAPRAEPVLPKVRRAWTRLRNRWVAVRRSVDLRELGRYHLSGQLPARIEELAALLARADDHLADTVTRLFGRIADQVEEAARLAEQGRPADEVHAALDAARAAVDPRFVQAQSDVAAIAADAVGRAARLVGGALAEVRRDAAAVGTVDLPRWRRRFARVFAERNRGLSALAAAIRNGRQ
ncbi:MAG: cation:proton antiporter, partial [Myxococcota bacterium]